MRGRSNLVVGNKAPQTSAVSCCACPIGQCARTASCHFVATSLAAVTGKGASLPSHFVEQLRDSVACFAAAGQLPSCEVGKDPGCVLRLCAVHILLTTIVCARRTVKQWRLAHRVGLNNAHTVSGVSRRICATVPCAERMVCKVRCHAVRNIPVQPLLIFVWRQSSIW